MNFLQRKRLLTSPDQGMAMVKHTLEYAPDKKTRVHTFLMVRDALDDAARKGAPTFARVLTDNYPGHLYVVWEEIA